MIKNSDPPFAKHVMTPPAVDSVLNRVLSTSSRLFASLLFDLRKNRTLLLMCLPALIVVFLVSYMPMPGIVLAFKNYRVAKGIWGSDWVGLNNFQFLLTSGIAWESGAKDGCDRIA